MGRSEQDVLRKKVQEFKLKLKEDKKYVSSVVSPRLRRKRRARSLPEESSDEEQGKYNLYSKREMTYFQAASDNEPAPKAAPNDTVKVHMYFGVSEETIVVTF